MNLNAHVARRLPTMSATIEQRVFITYRADPDTMRRLVPERYELRLTDGIALGGVCLIRLRHLRPSGFPAWVGLTSDSAAHRVSVLGPDGQPAIWAPRRDTNSRMSTAIGAAMFPNTPGRARFEQGANGLDLRCTDRTGETVASVTAAATSALPIDSIFSSTQQVCDYYRSARHGYSPSRTDVDSAIDLDIAEWEVEPLGVSADRSAVFSPLVEAGSAAFDHAVRMRNVNSTWRFSAS